MALSRPVAVAVAAAGIVATGAGVLCWQVAGTGRAPGLAQYAAVAVGASLFGGFVLWHKPESRYGRMHLALGLLFGTVVLAAGVLGMADGPPRLVAELALTWSWLALPMLLPLWVMVIVTFPDGTFHRRWLAPLTAGIGIVTAVLAIVARACFPAGGSLPLIAVHPTPELLGPFATVAPDGLFHVVSAAGAALGTAAPLLAVLALADRYRRSGLVARQQIKWLFAGAAVSVLVQTIPIGAIEWAALRVLTEVVVVLAVPLPLLAAAFAVFKLGLWEIDVAISHGVVYALLSVAFTALFLSVAFAAGVGIGGPDQRVLVALALAVLVSHLAHPLRQRLVSVVARALYGEGPRGLLALSLPPDRPVETDARSHGERVAAVTSSALAAPWVQVWLFVPGTTADGGRLRLLAGSGRPPGPPLLLADPAASALVGVSDARRVRDLPGPAAEVLAPMIGGADDLVATLVVDHELLGVLACGARRGDPYAHDERALLAVLARDAAQGLRNVRLAEELRLRLEEIEAQAEELRRSRQRLVGAQDDERRRIERDLHDGAQQQLVVLAAALRRVAGAEDSLELARLADQAEEAVYSLQELARGIYPSLLADRGLQAALQTLAARLPVDVRLEIVPRLQGVRLPRDEEAVLYYVALEAMTNTVKHAGQAQITVTLRTDDDARLAVLEVHDNGPGFGPGPPPTGSGLQNMSDRVAAAGGRLSVESAPGAGTWVHAEVPLSATVRVLRDGAGSP